MQITAGRRRALAAAAAQLSPACGAEAGSRTAAALAGSSIHATQGVSGLHQPAAAAHSSCGAHDPAAAALHAASCLETSPQSAAGAAPAQQAHTGPHPSLWPSLHRCSTPQRRPSAPGTPPWPSAAPPHPLLLRRSLHPWQAHLLTVVSTTGATPTPMAAAASHQLLQARGMAKTKVQVDYVPLQEPPRDPYSTEPTNYLQLLGSIQGAGTTNRLKHLVQHYGGAFDAAHLAAAIAVLPKLAQYRNEDLVRAPLLSIPDRSSGGEDGGGAQPPLLGPRLPRQGAKPRPSFLATAEPLALQLMAVLVGQANVRFAHPDRRGPGGVAARAQHASLWKLKVPAAPAAAALPASTTPPAAAAEGAVAAVRGGRALAGRGAAEQDDVPLGLRFSPREASTAVYAFGRLVQQGVHLDPQLLRACVRDCLEAFEGQGAGGRAGLGKATGADVALLVRGLSMLKAAQVSASSRLLARLGDWTAKHAGDFGVMDVQMSLRGFALLGHRDPPLVAALARRAAALAPLMAPAHVAHVLQSLASLGNDLAKWGNALAAQRQALRALASAVAPQVTILSHEDLAGLAVALAHLGPALAGSNDAAADGAAASPSPSSQAAEPPLELQAWGDERLQAAGARTANPASLPAWLHGLACFLADKARRDLAGLSPEQLSAVLRMLGALRVPHAPLLRDVVDGVLAERAVDPGLPPRAAAGVLRALGALAPLLARSAAPEELAPLPPPPDVRPSRPAHLPSKALEVLEKRQTGLGLGNLPALATPGPGGEEGAHPLALGAVLAEGEAPAAPPEGSRHAYRALLEDPTTPFEVRARAAARRVLEVYVSGRGEGAAALEAGGLEGLAELAEGLRDAGVEGVEGVAGQVLGEVVRAAERQIESLPGKRLGRDVPWTEAQLRQASRLLAASSQLAHPSTHLAAAASTLAQRALTAAQSQGPQAVAALLPPALQLLAGCRQLGAEPVPAAARAAAAAYVKAVQASTSSPLSTSLALAALPGHTASGLAPPAANLRPVGAQKASKRSAAKAKRKTAALDGPVVASLLQACAASGAVDDALAAAAALHAQQLWVGRGTGGGAADVWVVACVAPLVAHVAALQEGGRPLAPEVQEAVAALVRGAREMAERGGAAGQAMREVEGRLAALKPPYSGIAQRFESAL